MSIVRFDAWNADRDARTFEFRGQRGEIVAYDIGDVVPAIHSVQRAVAEGLHAAGFIAYEAAPAFESHFVCRPARSGLPLVWFGLFEERSITQMPQISQIEVSVEAFRPSVLAEGFRRVVAQIHEHIRAGDTYQVNYTFRLRTRFAGDEVALYQQICSAQHASYCAHLQLPRFTIMSASPELFFHWSGDELELRPMKGTRPRGRWIEEDDTLAAELVASEKERAENLMIVDLLRNDAGRVAEFGSVTVPAMFDVERFPTVQQMTSTVRARTRAGASLEDVLRALFPSGSVTGAPKIKTSEIIAQLEDAPRGPYAGAIGFVSPGEAMFSVAIRTLLLDRETNELELGVGAGITIDSDADSEYAECLAKAAFVTSRLPEFGLLESIRYDAHNGYFLLDEHLERMAASARYFGFGFNAEEIARQLQQCRPGFLAKVRVVVQRDGSFNVSAEALPDVAPAVVSWADKPIDTRDVFLYHKTTQRRPDVGEVLYFNERGELADSTIANVVVRLDGALLTPPIAAGVLPGIFRAHLIQQGEIRERYLQRSDVERADAIYLINSVRLWRDAILSRA